MEQRSSAERKVAITGIDNSEDEGFIASALFEQGWDIQNRALDADSLVAVAQKTTECDLTLFISSDLDGLDIEKLEVLKALSRKLFIFNNGRCDIKFDGEVELPRTSLELANLLRSSHRAPMMQRRESAREVTARIFALSSTTHEVGCTTFAINFAYELSALGHSVLLVDADHDSPSIAHSLDERSLHAHQGWRERPHKPALMELSKENILENVEKLDEAARTFDYIVVDIAKLTNLSTALISRRWEAEAVIWISKNASELWFLSTNSAKSLRTLKATINDVKMNEMKPKVRYFAVGDYRDRKSSHSLEAVREITKSSEKSSPIALPFDSRNSDTALARQKSLAEVNPRGELRKAIKTIAEKVSS